MINLPDHKISINPDQIISIDSKKVTMSDGNVYYLSDNDINVLNEKLAGTNIISGTDISSIPNINIDSVPDINVKYDEVLKVKFNEQQTIKISPDIYTLDSGIAVNKNVIKYFSGSKVYFTDGSWLGISKKDYEGLGATGDPDMSNSVLEESSGNNFGGSSSNNNSNNSNNSNSGSSNSGSGNSGNNNSGNSGNSGNNSDSSDSGNTGSGNSGNDSNSGGNNSGGSTGSDNNSGSSSDSGNQTGNNDYVFDGFEVRVDDLILSHNDGAIPNNTIKGVQTYGVIAGYKNKLGKLVIGNHDVGSEDYRSATNIIITGENWEMDSELFMLIPLTEGSEMQKKLNLIDHPENLHKEIYLSGDYKEYGGMRAITNVSSYTIEPEDREIESISLHYLNPVGQQFTMSNVLINGYVVGWNNDGSEESDDPKQIRKGVVINPNPSTSSYYMKSMDAYVEFAEGSQAQIYTNLYDQPDGLNQPIMLYCDAIESGLRTFNNARWARRPIEPVKLSELPY